jgi:hypothetical protein
MSDCAAKIPFDRATVLEFRVEAKRHKASLTRLGKPASQFYVKDT